VIHRALDANDMPIEIERRCHHRAYRDGDGFFATHDARQAERDQHGTTHATYAFIDMLPFA